MSDVEKISKNSATSVGLHTTPCCRETIVIRGTHAVCTGCDRVVSATFKRFGDTLGIVRIDLEAPDRYNTKKHLR